MLVFRGQECVEIVKYPHKVVSRKKPAKHHIVAIEARSPGSLT